MTHVRHAARYVQESMNLLVEDFLHDYGWTTDDAPFGADPFTVHRKTIVESDLVPQAPNAVFLSHGDLGAIKETQLGGGMVRSLYTFFVDILASDDSLALAVGCDVKDRLEGLFGGTRYLRPVNPGTGLELDGFLGEFEDVVLELPRPGLDYWRSVKATLVLDFPGDAQ